MDARTRRQINRELFDLTHTNPDLGTGIGRTIEIIEKHLGHIAVDSKEGEGTRFTIRMPYNPKVKPERAS